MLRAPVLVAFTVGCAGSPAPPPPAVASPAPPVPNLAPALPEAPAPARAIGAVPIPAGSTEPRPLDLSDTTVQLEHLPAPSALWRQHHQTTYAGRVLIALSTLHDDELLDGLYLSVVDASTDPESDYPGVFERWQLGPIDPTTTREGGNAFPSLGDPASNQALAPIKFAIRFLPREGAPETERKQVAVYTHGSTVYVAEKRLAATVWTPRLRLDMPRAKQIVPISPGWH